MDELVKLVSQQTGISEEMARKVVETVLGFVKQRLPAPVAAQVESVLSGEDLAGKAGDALKGLGSLLNR